MTAICIAFIELGFWILPHEWVTLPPVMEVFMMAFLFVLLGVAASIDFYWDFITRVILSFSIIWIAANLFAWVGPAEAMLAGTPPITDQFLAMAMLLGAPLGILLGTICTNIPIKYIKNRKLFSS